MLYHHHHESLREFIDSTPPLGGEGHLDNPGVRTDSERNNFTKSADYPTALALLEYGNVTGLREISEAKASLTHLEPTRPDFTTILNTEGAYPNIDAFIHGEPENMHAFVPTKIIAPTITIAANIAVSAGVPGATIIKRGALIAAAIDHLEHTGVRVELIIFSANNSWSDNATDDVSLTTILAKRADEPLDLDKMSFCLCHPSMNRRLMFNYQRHLPADEVKKFGYGTYGYYGVPNAEYKHPTADYTFKGTLLNKSDNLETIIADITAALNVKATT